MLQALAFVLIFGWVSGPTTVDLPDAALLCNKTLAGGVGVASPVYCVADCDPYPDVSCSGNVSCQAVDRNCPSQRGYVVCDGSYTYCPVCPECADGNFRLLNTGECCDYPAIGELKYFQKCMGGLWVTQRSFCGPSGQCPIYP